MRKKNDKILRALDLVLKHYQREFQKSVKNECFNDTQKNDYLFYISNIINKLGDLSEPLFNLKPKLKNYFMTKYGDILGRHLFDMKYANIHQQYDKIKDFAHDLYDEIEMTEIQVYF